MAGFKKNPRKKFNQKIGVVGSLFPSLAVKTVETVLMGFVKLNNGAEVVEQIKRHIDNDFDGLQPEGFGDDEGLVVSRRSDVSSSPEMEESLALAGFGASLQGWWS